MKKPGTLTHLLPDWGSRGQWLVVAMMLLSLGLWAQDTDKTDSGQVVNGYELHQTVEAGGRVVGYNGSGEIFNTFVDLRSGPRLLDYSLNLHSIEHKGSFVDDLSFTNTGYGGDPDTVTRLRASKNRWYDFSMQLRRDINYYDYNAFANPYNYGPTVAVPTRPTVVNFNDSIHQFNTRRKMGDFNLTVLPQSAIRFRLGYSRSMNSGQSWSSFHEGTDVQLYHPYDSTQDTWTFGADWRFAPRTQVTFDHILVLGDDSNSYVDTNVGNSFLTLGGQARPIDIGAIWYPYYNQPCANAAVGAAGLTPVTCGIYAGYSRTGSVHTNMPTERLTFNSNYWKKADLNGSFGYTHGESYIRNYHEVGNAYVTRTNEVGFQFDGPTNAIRKGANADFGITFHLTDSWSISNQTRWANYRQPGFWFSTEFACFPNAASGVNVFTPPGLPYGGGTSCAGVAASGTPVHTAASGPDFDAVNYARSFNMRTAYNTTSLAWDPSKRFGAHLGYRFGRVKVVGEDFDSETAVYLAPSVGTRLAPGTYATAVPDADDALVVNDEQTEHAVLFGLQFRPLDAWRINADYEYVYDNVPLTPIAPQHSAHVKLRTNYRFSRWLSLSGSAILVDNRNSVVAQNPDGSNAFPTGYYNPRHTDSSNMYAANFLVEPNKYVTFDLGYTFNHYESHTGSCLMASTSGSGASTNLQALTPLGGPIQRCPNVGDPFVPGLLGAAIPSILDYAQDVHTGYVALQIRPVSRLAFTLGVDATTDDGKNNWLRADSNSLLEYPIDAVGNVVYAGNAQAGPIVGYAPGPNPWQPFGTLGMKWLKPNAGVAVDVTKHLTFKGEFNYWDYREKGPTGPRAGLTFPIAPRNFTAKAGTLALRYSF